MLSNLASEWQEQCLSFENGLGASISRYEKAL